MQPLYQLPYGHNSDIQYLTEDREVKTSVSQYFEQARSILKGLLSKKTPGCKPPLALDIETYYPDYTKPLIETASSNALNPDGPDPFIDKIRLLSLRIAYTQLPTLVIDLKTTQRETHLYVIREALSWQVWLGHNIKFDLVFLITAYPEIHKTQWLNLFCADTMILDQVLSPETFMEQSYRLSRKRNLRLVMDDWIQRNLISKELQTSNWAMEELEERQIIYSAMDVALLGLLFQKMAQTANFSITSRRTALDRLKAILREIFEVSDKSVETTLKTTMPYHAIWLWNESLFLPVLAYTEAHGIRMNVDLMHVVHKENTQKLREAEEAIRQYTKDYPATQDTASGDDLAAVSNMLFSVNNQITIANPHSGPQVYNYLAALGYTLPLTEKNTPKTSLDALKEVLGETHEFYVLMETLNHYQNVVSKLAEFFNYIDSEGILRTSFSQIAAPTGRMAASRPAIMNVLPFLREFFIPYTKTQILGDFDFSQEELRVVAAYANDLTMLQAYMDNKDLHRLTAAKLNGIPEEDVTKEQRKNAKAANFGLIYGMGAKSFQQYAKLNYGVVYTESEAKQVKNIYMQTYDGVADLIQTVFDLVENPRPMVSYPHLFIKNGTVMVESRSNRLMQGGGVNDTLNYPIQGTGADILKLSAILFYKRLQKVSQTVSSAESLSSGQNDIVETTRILNFVHDEILLSVETSYKEVVSTTIQQSMLTAGALLVPEIAIPTEGCFGINWKEIH